MVCIAFSENSITERGSTTALFDYAYYNKHYLQNESIIIYTEALCKETLRLFENEFKTFQIRDRAHMDQLLAKHNCSILYRLQSGEQRTLMNDRTPNSLLSKVAKNVVHCVFNMSRPQGDVYAAISKVVQGNNLQFPIVPHMISPLPSHDEHLRDVLHIPHDAVVFGGYGGKQSFSIPYARRAVEHVARTNPHIYFVFANFDPPFDPTLKNIIVLPKITCRYEKVKLINTCDAMLWARHDGETFGLAIGEFSSKNKPVICTKVGALNHAHVLGDKGIYYHSFENLVEILTTFDKKQMLLLKATTSATADEGGEYFNAFKEYTPEKVMDVFHNVFIKPCL
jgi:hypothetical protein